MKYRKVDKDHLVATGTTILGYKKSFNNEGKRFYYHKNINLRPNNLYITGSSLIFIGRNGDLFTIMLYNISRENKKIISTILRNGGTVQEAIEFLSL